MFRAEDISGRTARKKQPHTSILPYLRSEAYKETQGKDPIEKSTRASIATPEEQLKGDKEALCHLSPPSDDELVLKALLEEV